MGLKPFLRWAGGKRKLLETIRPIVQEEMATRSIYIEPFLGGGAVFLDLLERSIPAEEGAQKRRFVLADVNPHLIETWRVVRDNLAGLWDHVEQNRSRYVDTPERYNELRREFNTLASLVNNTREEMVQREISRAALFIYLNRTSLNGLWRVNHFGKYDTPYGKRGLKEVFDVDMLANIERISLAMSRFDILLYQVGFVELFADCRDLALIEMEAKRFEYKDAFVYVDPPYAPITSTSFTAYAGPFDSDDQQNLKGALSYFAWQNGSFLASNSDCEFTRKLYESFNIQTVKAARSINSDRSGRGKINELLIRG